MLYLYHIEENVRTLGPGLRFVIWFQGCLHNCKGCIVKESHPLDRNGTWYSVEEIVDSIKKQNDLRGVTISGGEPFLQDKELLNLVLEINKLNLDIICYSGFKYEYLMKKSEYSRKVLENIDILIDGKYIEELNDNSYLRGSSNQRIVHLKNTYRIHEELINNSKNRNIEFIIKSGEIFIAGIPSNEINVDEDYKNIIKKIYIENAKEK